MIMAGTRRLLLLWLPALVNLLTLPVAIAQVIKPIRINCGSTETKTDSLGRIWQADKYYSRGTRTWTAKGVNVLFTSDDFLYRTERYDTENFKYTFTVPQGQYDVRLLFAENFEKAEKKRVFDVKIENRLVFRNVDIFKNARGKNRKWDSPVHRATVSDGRLTIEFINKGIGNPKIGAIEILPVATSGRVGSSSLHRDIRKVLNVNHKGRGGQQPMGKSWADSYSRDGKCYCDGVTTYDHDIENFRVNTPVGWKTVREVCELIGPGPGRKSDDPIYNDVQCGNGPPNTAKDEHTCPGRVDLGFDGCGQIGPKWNFESLPTHSADRHRFFLDVGGDDDTKYLATGKTWTYNTRNAGRNRVAIENNGGIPASVFETHRSASGTLRFQIGGFEAAAPYQVSLGFAEVWPANCKAGQRIMSITINGNPYANKLDVWKEAGGCGGALTKKYVLTANGSGQFDIVIGASIENAMLSSIDIVPLVQ